MVIEYRDRYRYHTIIAIGIAIETFLFPLQAVPLAALYGLAPAPAPHPPPPPPHLSLGPASVPPSVISAATTVRRARSVAEISNGGFSMAAAHHHHQQQAQVI